MASACLADPAAAFAQMADDYILQEYEHGAPGKQPKRNMFSEVFGAKLPSVSANAPRGLAAPALSAACVHQPRPPHHCGARAGCARAARLPGRVCDQRSEPQKRWRLARARHLLRLARCAAAAPEGLPHPLGRARCDQPAAEHSCEPARSRFWLDAVHDIPARHAARIGTAASPTITCTSTTRRCTKGWCSIRTSRRPSFQLARQGPSGTRHRATEHTRQRLGVSPTPEWIATLPNAKLPDRNDFKHYGDDVAGRIKPGPRQSSRAALA